MDQEVIPCHTSCTVTAVRERVVWRGVWGLKELFVPIARNHSTYFMVVTLVGWRSGSQGSGV